MIQCKNSQVYKWVCVSLSVSVSVWQEVVAYYCITNDRQPPPQTPPSGTNEATNLPVSPRYEKASRYCRQLFICRYIYIYTLYTYSLTRIHIHSSASSYVGSLCGDRLQYLFICECLAQCIKANKINKNRNWLRQKILAFIMHEFWFLGDVKRVQKIAWK